MARLDPSGTLARDVMIVAPHTHWDENRPVVIQADGVRYLAGPMLIDVRRKYRAVSFVFSPQGPLAYEWADSSVKLNLSKLSRLYELIMSICGELRACELRWPFGLSINYRFRRLGSNEMPSTTEYPAPEKALREDQISAIVPTHVIRHKLKDGEVEQVAWHAFASDLTRTSTLTRNVKLQIEDILNANSEGPDRDCILRAALQRSAGPVCGVADRRDVPKSGRAL
jgi:hypothetical protein